MPSVCILGGGYAGLRVARELSGRLDPNWSISLVDRNACHQLLTRLPEVVVSTISPGEACIPFEELLPRRVRLRRETVTAVDLRTRQVETTEGVLAPDILVVALGTAPDLDRIPGAREHALPLKSVQDAIRIRDALAALRTSLETARIVVVGAGYTGTEIAGELSAEAYRKPGARGPARLDVRIVAEDLSLLPQGSRRIGTAVERILRARGVPIDLGQHVSAVNETGLQTAAGATFEADLVVWAGQTRVATAVQGRATTGVPDGKLRVDPYLRVTAGDSVFACGDVSLAFDYVRDQNAASSAQLAVQAGELVARNVEAVVRGRPLHEYRPRVIGEALALGGTDAVAEVGGLLLYGRTAAAVKRAALVRYLAGLSHPMIV